MQKYLSMVLSLVIVIGTFFYVKSLKEDVIVTKIEHNIGSFTRQKSCSKQPNFLKKLRINSPVAIDLSQQKYKGLAFLYGQGLSQVLHLKSWEKFDHFSTYALDPKGNMYLSPMPYISMKENTLEFQQNIYRLDTNSGKLEVWMSLKEVHAGSNNPYGIISLDYDCDDHTLWVSAIDETDYRQRRGVIYHIDIVSKKILQRLEGVDALTLKLLKSDNGKYLLYGDARENGLYALKILESKLSTTPLKLVELSNSSERVRKIKIGMNDALELQTIPFSYTLIAETSNMDTRNYYKLQWSKSLRNWKLLKKADSI